MTCIPHHRLAYIGLGTMGFTARLPWNLMGVWVGSGKSSVRPAVPDTQRCLKQTERNQKVTVW